MNLKGNRIGAVGAYTFTSPNRVYSRIDLRSSYGSLKYQGSGTLDDVPDWIFETRAVIGRDYLTGDSAALSPYIGLGYRYLYNDLRGYSSTGHVGYQRVSQYLYVPVGLTARFRTGERWVVAPTVEYDVFLGGRQYSQLCDTGIGYSDATNQPACTATATGLPHARERALGVRPMVAVLEYQGLRRRVHRIGHGRDGAGKLDPRIRRGAQVPLLMQGRGGKSEKMRDEREREMRA